jgi:Putative 2OG-Fe(II) oxygenase
MAASKPQIRSLFATPVAIHFLPVAQDANATLRPLIAERAGPSLRGQGWRSDGGASDWLGEAGQTLFRVVRDLADSATSTRSGGRVTLDWRIEACACLRHKGDYREAQARPGAVWSGVYYVDDGYAKSDDAALGGECELFDPRGPLPAMVAPQYAFRIPGGLTAGESELIRPQSGMILLHPSWLARGERQHGGDNGRVTVEFDLLVP